MAFGVYGKLPARGDFVEAGLPAPLRAVLEGWLDRVLAEARETLGPMWEGVWAAAPPVMFWVGEGVWGEVVAGALLPAQDRVGRRFPLLMVATGPDAPPPPVTLGAGGWHAALAAHLLACRARPDFAAVSDLLTAAPRPAPEGPAAAPDYWAARPGPVAEALWADLALADHRLALAGRSYWWTEGAAESEPEPDLSEPEAPEPDPLPDIAPADPPEEPEAAEDTAPDAPATPPPEAEEADPWALADLPEDEGSPFDTPAGGGSLFAAPEPASLSAPEPAAVLAAEAPPPGAPVTAPPRPAQVWAGGGLPTGAVLAWFFRGHAGNG